MDAKPSLKGRLRHTFDIAGVRRSLQAVDQNELAMRRGAGLMLQYSDGGRGLDPIVALGGWKTGEVDFAGPEISSDGGEMGIGEEGVKFAVQSTFYRAASRMEGRRQGACSERRVALAKDPAASRIH